MTIYKINFEREWNAVVAIDHDTADPLIKEMVEFWTDWENRLAVNEGSYTQTFLQQLGDQLVRLSTEMRLKSAIEVLRRLEGWTAMDGSRGIAILEMDEWQWDRDRFDVDVHRQGQWVPIERQATQEEA